MICYHNRVVERDINTKDPDAGDVLLIENERYDVMERCPCGQEAQHIRWFLQGEGVVEDACFPQEAVLAKEWEPSGELWWWFGRRIALSDLRSGRSRLMRALRRDRQDPPKRLFYEGRLYRLVHAGEPSQDANEDSVPLTVWEYVDAEETESVLVEASLDGETVAYHGAYYDPELIKTST